MTTERGTAPLIVIAAGGAGTRIGGAKAERSLGGRRLLDHAIGWARRHSDSLALAVAGSAPGDPAGLPLLDDRHPGVGPIAALHSAMAHAATLGRARVLLIGCDTPFLPDDLVPRLLAAIGQAGAALPRRGARVHPLAGLWRTDPAAVDRWIAGGGRSPWGYAERAGLVLVDWPVTGDDPFANLNTPADLAAAEIRLTAAGR